METHVRMYTDHLIRATLSRVTLFVRRQTNRKAVSSCGECPKEARDSHAKHISSQTARSRGTWSHPMRADARASMRHATTISVLSRSLSLSSEWWLPTSIIFCRREASRETNIFRFGKVSSGKRVTTQWPAHLDFQRIGSVVM